MAEEKPKKKITIDEYCKKHFVKITRSTKELSKLYKKCLELINRVADNKNFDPMLRAKAINDLGLVSLVLDGMCAKDNIVKGQLTQIEKVVDAVEEESKKKIIDISGPPKKLIIP